MDLWVAQQCSHQCAVSAHAVTHDAKAMLQQRKFGRHHGWQLLGDVVQHLVVFPRKTCSKTCNKTIGQWFSYDSYVHSYDSRRIQNWSSLWKHGNSTNLLVFLRGRVHVEAGPDSKIKGLEKVECTLGHTKTPARVCHLRSKICKPTAHWLFFSVSKLRGNHHFAPSDLRLAHLPLEGMYLAWWEWASTDEIAVYKEGVQ